jgi:hypothetical protein
MIPPRRMAVVAKTIQLGDGTPGQPGTQSSSPAVPGQPVPGALLPQPQQAIPLPPPPLPVPAPGSQPGIMSVAALAAAYLQSPGLGSTSSTPLPHPPDHPRMLQQQQQQAQEVAGSHSRAGSARRAAVSEMAGRRDFPHSSSRGHHTNSQVSSAASSPGRGRFPSDSSATLQPPPDPYAPATHPSIVRPSAQALSGTRHRLGSVGDASAQGRDNSIDVEATVTAATTGAGVRSGSHQGAAAAPIPQPSSRVPPVSRLHAHSHHHQSSSTPSSGLGLGLMPISKNSPARRR